jgi:hypothetical protein
MTGMTSASGVEIIVGSDRTENVSVSSVRSSRSTPSSSMAPSYGSVYPASGQMPPVGKQISGAPPSGSTIGTHEAPAGHPPSAEQATPQRVLPVAKLSTQ